MNTTAARRAATATAGLVLIAGALLQVAVTYPAAFHTNRLAAEVSAYDVVFGTWGLAAIAGMLRYLLVAMNAAASARPRKATPPFVLFSVGAALMLPTTLHAIVFLFDHQSARDLREWMQLSLIITSTAHVAFAWMTGVRAANLTKDQPGPSIAFIFGTTVAVSAIPFGVLYMIPPLLVGITGLPILLLLRVMPTYAAYDRNGIEVPRARVVA